jgi:hypothetical protein
MNYANHKKLFCILINNAKLPNGQYADNHKKNYFND